MQLHSSLSEGGARWTFQSTSPTHTLRCDSYSLVATLSSASEVEQQWTDPLAALQWMASHPGKSSGSRWVGYLSYDLGRLFEPIPVIAQDDLHLPLFYFSLFDSDLIGAPVVTPTAGPCRCDAKMRPRHPSESPAYAGVRCGENGSGDRTVMHSRYSSPSPSPESTLPKTEYLDRVTRAIEYIRAGDVFQVNLAQRFKTPLTISPRQTWQNLLHNTPATYGAFLDCGDHCLISNSPELFLHVTPNRKIITRPVKGTRARKPGMNDELRHSPKDQAELNMIVDLERNDLGRICEIGSVRVTQPRTIETHPTVYHGVATIEGQLKVDVTFIDLLRATFPGGSITGAPKIRAMQIIEELEPMRRGPYCGAIGYLAADGSLQFNIAIRTIIVKDDFAYIPVGGGIVADSDPATEYEETMTKAAAMFGALNL
jgi:anthranilate/para-aminobenzoate synthase component I